MIPGYNEFPEDVRQVFSNTISTYSFETVLSEPDAVALLNDKVQIGFSINEDTMNMSLKSDGKFYNVTDVVPMIDRNFYAEWRSALEAAIKNLGRREYYLTYLNFYRQLSEKYFLGTYATG